MDSELGDRGLIFSESDGENGRDGGNQNAARPLSYTEQFERVCPYYMAMGMTYDQFWNGDVDAVRMFRKCFEIQKDFEHQRAWEHGVYVYESLCAVAPIFRAFSKAKKPMPYPEKPHGLESERRQMAIEEKQKTRDDKARASMEVFMIGFNRQFAAKGERSNG